ncbi:hypothetical protein P3L10_028261 [Capsicum annuum]
MATGRTYAQLWAPIGHFVFLMLMNKGFLICSNSDFGDNIKASRRKGS